MYRERAAPKLSSPKPSEPRTNTTRSARSAKLSARDRNPAFAEHLVAPLELGVVQLSALALALVLGERARLVELARSEPRGELLDLNALDLYLLVQPRGLEPALVELEPQRVQLVGVEAPRPVAVVAGDDRRAEAAHVERDRDRRQVIRAEVERGQLARRARDEVDLASREARGRRAPVRGRRAGRRPGAARSAGALGGCGGLRGRLCFGLATQSHHTKAPPARPS